MIINNLGITIVVTILFIQAIGCTESESKDNENKTPTVKYLIIKEGGNTIISIKNVYIQGGASQGNLPKNATHYQLRNDEKHVLEGNLTEKWYGYIPIEFGGTGELTGKTLRNETNGNIISNIQWFDLNSDWKLTTGDTITILGVNNNTWDGEPVEPGIAEPGWTLDLIWAPTQEIMTSIVI